jgi:hypothetical protein
MAFLSKALSCLAPIIIYTVNVIAHQIDPRNPQNCVQSEKIGYEEPLFMVYGLVSCLKVLYPCRLRGFY